MVHCGHAHHGMLMSQRGRSHHSTFSLNRLGRFWESEILRHIFERVVATSMAAGLVKGEGFAVDASVMEANASRYYGKAPDELDWSDAQAA
jgi:transposase